MMLTQLKNWALEVLTPTSDGSRVDLKIQRSGAVQFDVSAFLGSEAGKRQLAAVHDLTTQLHLRHHDSA
jgi:hypothetical protein